MFEFSRCDEFILIFVEYFEFFNKVIKCSMVSVFVDGLQYGYEDFKGDFGIFKNKKI